MTTTRRSPPSDRSIAPPRAFLSFYSSTARAKKPLASPSSWDRPGLRPPWPSFAEGHSSARSEPQASRRVRRLEPSVAPRGKRSKTDLHAELHDSVGRNTEVVSGRSRVAGDERKESLSPRKHPCLPGREKRLASEEVARSRRYAGDTQLGRPPHHLGHVRRFHEAVVCGDLKETSPQIGERDARRARDLR